MGELKTRMSDCSFSSYVGVSPQTEIYLPPNLERSFERDNSVGLGREFVQAGDLGRGATSLCLASSLSNSQSTEPVEFLPAPGSSASVHCVYSYSHGSKRKIDGSVDDGPLHAEYGADLWFGEPDQFRH